MADLSRSEIIREALAQHGAFIVVSTLEEAFNIANRVAPEHLEVIVKEPMSWLGAIMNAGAIFLGPYSPEPVGITWPDKTTSCPPGAARFYSPVTVDTFMKKSSVIYYSPVGFDRCRGYNKTGGG